MFYRYEIKNNGKENILYLYLNMAYEFSRELVLDVNHDEITRRTKNFIKNNNINYDGDKVYLVIDGIVVKTLDINSVNEPEEVNTGLSYSNDKFLITLKLDDNKFIEVTMRDFLLEQGVWEREVDEVLSNFNNDVTEDDLVIVAIFDSAFDLGNNYIDNVVGELDHHIDAVLDYTSLGEHLAESCDEYMLLDSGRIIEFEL